MKKLFLTLGLVSAMLIVVVGFVSRNSSGSTSTNKLQVVVSFYPLDYFTSQIGGDRVQVTNITPAAAEPHDYDPTTQDIVAIEGANVLVLNGGVEAWGEKIKNTLRGTNVKMVTAGQGLLTKQLTENGQSGTDPHIWLDPLLAKQEAHTIALALESIDPSNRAQYVQREQTLDAKLDQLDAAYRVGLQHCQQHDIITSHAAFAYLGARYGLTQVPITGFSPDAEPSAQQLADVTNFAKANHVTYIFFERLVSPKLADTIAREVGAKTMVLDPLEGIPTTDQLAGQDYISIMQHNLQNLQTALQCTT